MTDIDNQNLTHDQTIAGIQRFYDYLFESHDTLQTEERHQEKELVLALLDEYSNIFDSIICYHR